MAWRNRRNAWQEAARVIRNQGGTGGSQTRRGPQKISQTVAGMRSAGPQSWETQQAYYNDPGIQQAREWWQANTATGQRSDYENYMASYMQNPGGLPGAAAPGGPGGGGGGGGWGGGGGGGAPMMSQAMLDQMLAALGARGPALALQQTDLPDFQGQAWQDLPAFQGTPMAAFNAAPYSLAQRQLERARARDAAAITAAGTQATQALQNNYQNAYANTQVAPGPEAAAVGVGLQQTAGGGGDQQAVTDVNQAAAGDQASFQNLLGVLAAADQQSQASRLNEAALNTNTAQLGLGAQVRGLGAGINMARTQAQTQWQQLANERAYQNNMMRQQWARENMQARNERAYQNAMLGQQWAREEAMRNQDIANQQSQANWQQSNELISTRLQPLLELIGSTAGATGLNLAGIQNLLKLWGQGAR